MGFIGAGQALRSAAQVNAGAQAEAYGRIEKHLSQEELEIARRGANAHARHHTPKNQNPVAYSQATGLEAVLGYLYLTGQMARIAELFDIGAEMP
jgi:ribonuclease-3 family protein